MLCLFTKEIKNNRYSGKRGGHMKLRLKEDYRIDFTHIDFTGNISLNGIADYMQIVAANHAGLLGFDFYNEEKTSKYYWVISRVKYNIKKYPKWLENISLETYPGGYSGLFAVRLFTLFDESGEEIGEIIGDYVLMDTERGRPARIKGAPAPLNILDFPYEGECLQKLELPDEILKEEIRKARYSEIDLNQHMNNAQYIKWILDMFSLETFREKEVSSLQINYNTSISYGTEVKVKLGRSKEGSYMVYGTSLEGETIYFTSDLILREK